MEIPSNFAVQWETIKSKSECYLQLQTTEEEISKHFQNLHEFLRLQEYKLKKPINHDKELIENDVDKFIIDLKLSLNNNSSSSTGSSSSINIKKNKSNASVNYISSLQNTNNISENNDIMKLLEDIIDNKIDDIDLNSQQQESSSPSPQHHHHHHNTTASDTTSDLSTSFDRAELYQTTNIINSIQHSDSLNQFIDENKYTLYFNNKSHNSHSHSPNFNSSYYYTNSMSIGGGSSSPQLHSHNSHLHHSHTDEYHSIIKKELESRREVAASKEEFKLEYDYKLNVNTELINNIKQEINQSIKLLKHANRNSIIKQQQQQSNNTNSGSNISKYNNNGSNMKSYLFSAERESATLIDFDTTKVVNSRLPSDIKYWTFNSMVTVGEYVYHFGGWRRQESNRYQRYSVKTNTIDINEVMPGVEKSSFMSACYDGLRYIYILDGWRKFITEIYRYCVVTRKFEHFSTIKELASYQYLSFVYKDQIYSISPHNRILRFDPATKQYVFLQLRLDYIEDEELKPDIIKYELKNASMCTDGDGKVYIQNHVSNTNRKLFYRINVESMIVTMLSANLSDSYTQNNLVYHNNNIYYILGKDKNFKYSIENDEWSTVMDQYKGDKSCYGSILVRF